MPTTPANLLRRAMQDSDRYVIQLRYRDSRGQWTRRVISPIRFLGRDRLLALCLCRGEPRQFYLDRCEGLSLCPAEQFVMPLGELPLDDLAPEKLAPEKPASSTPSLAVSPVHPLEFVPAVAGELAGA